MGLDSDNKGLHQVLVFLFPEWREQLK